jgi:hypothetical protein
MQATSGWRDGDRSPAAVPPGDVVRARDVARVVELRARVQGTGARVGGGDAVREDRREQEAAGMRLRVAVGGAPALCQVRHEPPRAEADDLLDAEGDDHQVVGVTGVDDPLGDSERARGGV